MSTREQQKEALASIPNPMPYLEAFAQLGPRPTCSEQEKKAAQHVKDKMEAMGLDVQEDRFMCNYSMFRPHMAIFWFVVALGVLPVLFDKFGIGYALAAAGCLVARKFYTDLLHNKPNAVVSALPKKPCRNVIAKLAPTGAVKNRIVLMSHLDSAICSPIFGEKMVKSLKTNIKIDRVLFVVLAGLYAASFVSQSIWPYYLALAASIYVLGSLLVLLYSEMFSPYSPGVNDNGSGVAAVLAFAEGISKSPLKNSEVWFVALGAEEPGTYGAKDLWKNHASALKASYIINIDSVAVGQPRYLVNEGYTEEYRCSSEMINILQKYSEENPSAALSPYEFKGFGGYTDCTHLLQNGCKAISLVSTEADGLIKNWHTPKDTLEGIQPETYGKIIDAVNHLVHTLDRKFSY